MTMKKLIGLSLLPLISLTFSGCKDGAPGISTLVSTTVESPGTNCASGGTRIDTGADANSNGQLDADEISSTSYVCTGSTGAEVIFSSTAEPAGTNCELGGLRIDAGHDDDGDDILDAEEVDWTDYVCSFDHSLTIVTDIAPSQDCPGGGIQVDNGVDANGDGALTGSEIQTSRTICNGVDGNVDEEIRFIFPAGRDDLGTDQAIGLYYVTNEFVDFDISNYPGVQSAVFRAYLRTSNGFVPANVQLYDGLNDNFIDNTLLSTSNMSYDSQETGANFIGDFPTGTFNLGIVVWPDEDGTMAEYSNAELVLYR